MKARDILNALGPESSMTRRSSVYVKPHAAKAVVTQCEAHDVAVLGLEGFYVSANAIEPEMKLIRDFSRGSLTPWEMYRTKCNARAATFVSQELDEILQELGRTDLFLEFVLKDRPQSNS